MFPSAPRHSTSLLQESQTNTNPAFGLGKHTASARLSKALLSFENQFSVPNAGLSEASPCPTTAASYPPVGPGPCPAPRLSGPAQVSRTKDGNRGCRRVPATPPVLAGLGRLCPAGRRATRGVLGADGPSGAQGRRQGGRGPDLAGGRPGWSAVRLRERRRTRGAYCW